MNNKFHEQAINPITGELNMLTKRFVKFEELTVTSNTATWDCSGNLNRIMYPTNNTTLNLTNVKNGMVGLLTIDLVAATTPINITLVTAEPNKGLGTLTGLEVGETYTFAWYYDGVSIKWNIEKYS
jgi:hypothetical protein